MRTQVKYWLLRIASFALCAVPAVIVLALFGGLVYTSQGSKISAYGFIAIVVVLGVFKDKIMEFIGKPSFIGFPIALLLFTLMYDWMGQFITALKYMSITMLVCVILDRLFLYPKYKRLYAELHPQIVKAV